MPITPASFPVPLLLGVQSPLDARQVVANLNELTTSWGAGGNVYEGMTVYVQSNDSLYVLVNVANYNVAVSEASTGWKKLATLTTINGEEVNSDNIVISLAATYAGLSSSAGPYDEANLGPNYDQFPALSGSFPYYKNADQSTPGSMPGTGSLWVVTGETITARTASNGKMFIFASSSILSGRWIPISPLPNSIVTSYLNNYFNDNTVPTADSASAVLSQNFNAVDSGQLPLMFVPSSAGIGSYRTPAAVSDVYYDLDTSLLNVTSSWAKNANTASAIQTSDGTIIEGDSIVYVNNEGDIIYGDGQTANAGIKYFTGSASTTQDYTASLRSLQIINYFQDTLTINFDEATGKLILYFGTPDLPQISNITDSNTWNTNRFNTTPDDFTISSTWNNGSYNFVSASLQRWIYNPTPGWETLVTKTAGVDGVNTTTISVTPNANTNTPYLLTGSSYAGATIAALFNYDYPVAASRWRVVYTGSNPSTGEEYRTTQILKKELNVALPGNPSMTFTYQSDQISSWNIANPASTTAPTIEYGDTGELVAVPAEGSLGLWSRKSVTSGQGIYQHYLYAPSNTLTHAITNNQNNTKFSVTASYYTATANNPDPTIPRYSPTYTLARKRSVRFGRIEVESVGTTAPVLTSADLLDVGNWANDLYNSEDAGGPFIMDQGRIYWNKSDNPSTFGTGYPLSLTCPVSLNYFYIVINNTYSLSSIAAQTLQAVNLLGGAWILVGEVGSNWKVYRTASPQQISGTAGGSIDLIIS